MTLAELLSAELEITLAGNGETLEEVFAYPFNQNRLWDADKPRVAEVVQRGCRLAGTVGDECIDIAVWSIAFADDGYLDGHEAYCARLGRFLVPEAAWVERLLVVAEQGGERGDRALDALRMLVELGQPARIRDGIATVVPRIVALVDGPFAPVALETMHAIAQFHRDDVRADLDASVPAVVAALRDPALCDWAAAALGAIGSSTAIAPLIEVLANPAVPDPVKAWSVADALAKLGATEAVPALIALLAASTDDMARSRYTKALEVLAPERA